MLYLPTFSMENLCGLAMPSKFLPALFDLMLKYCFFVPPRTRPIILSQIDTWYTQGNNKEISVLHDLRLAIAVVYCLKTRQFSAKYVSPFVFCLITLTYVFSIIALVLLTTSFTSKVSLCIWISTEQLQFWLDLFLFSTTATKVNSLKKISDTPFQPQEQGHVFVWGFVWVIAKKSYRVNHI